MSGQCRRLAAPLLAHACSQAAPPGASACSCPRLAVPLLGSARSSTKEAVVAGCDAVDTSGSNPVWQGCLKRSTSSEPAGGCAMAACAAPLLESAKGTGVRCLSAAACAALTSGCTRRKSACGSRAPKLLPPTLLGRALLPDTCVTTAARAAALAPLAGTVAAAGCTPVLRLPRTPSSADTKSSRGGSSRFGPRSSALLCASACGAAMLAGLSPCGGAASAAERTWRWELLCVLLWVG